MSLNCGAEEVSWESLGDQPSQRNQPWIFIGRTNAEAEAPIFWSADVKNWFIGKDPDAGKDWRWEEKGRTEGKMVGWHHWLNGHEFEQAGSWWWTGKPVVLQSMRSQRVRHKWVTELNWTEPMYLPPRIWLFPLVMWSYQELSVGLCC